MIEDIPEIESGFAVIVESKSELMKMISKKLNQIKDIDSQVATVIEISG